MIWGYNIGGHIEDLPLDLDKTSDGIILSSTTNNNIKGLRKYGHNGNLLWQFDLFENLPKGEGSEYVFLESAVDENDNVYSLLRLDEPTAVINGITFHNGISVIKFDKNGNVIWSEKVSSNVSNIEANLLYNNGEVFVIGTFSLPITINDQIKLKSQQYYDCNSFIWRDGIDYYIAKFDSTGNLMDAISFGTEYHDHIVSAAIDSSSNIYFTGGSGFHSCTTRYTHITKFNSNLKLEWEKEISKEENGSQLIYPSNIYYSDLSNKLYLWGYNFQAIIHDDYNIPTSPCYIRGERIGANLMEFDNSGNFIKYRHYANCTVNDIWQVGGNVTLDTINKAGIAENGDELIILSSIRGSMKFDNGVFNSTYIITQYNEFFWDENLFLMTVNKNDFSSKFIARLPGEDDNKGPISIDNPNKIILDSTNLYISASFVCNPIYVFGSPVYNNSGNNDSDILIAKVDFSDALSNASEYSNPDFYIYPNPADNFIFFKPSSLNISKAQIYSLTGSLIKEYELNTNIEKLDISELTNGVYFIKLIDLNNKVLIRKIIINNQ